jgi:hypothetical protein
VRSGPAFIGHARTALAHELLDGEANVLGEVVLPPAALPAAAATTVE